MSESAMPRGRAPARPLQRIKNLRRPRRLACTLPLCFAVCLGSVWAAEQTFIFQDGLDGFEGVEDTSIFSESNGGVWNAGGATNGIFSGTIRQLDFFGNFQNRRALLRVDLSAIPAGATVRQAGLRLVIQASGIGTAVQDYALHALEKPWGEGVVDAGSDGGRGGAPGEGDATWMANRHNVSQWAGPGGDFAAEASATASAAGPDSEVRWSSPGMAADVQGWIDDPAANHGWIIIGALEGVETRRVKKFYSSEAADLAVRPMLTVVIGPPRTDTGAPKMPAISGAGLAAGAALTLAAGAAALRQMRPHGGQGGSRQDSRQRDGQGVI